MLVNIFAESVEYWDSHKEMLYC